MGAAAFKKRMQGAILRSDAVQGKAAERSNARQSYGELRGTIYKAKLKGSYQRSNNAPGKRRGPPLSAAATKKYNGNSSI